MTQPEPPRKHRRGSENRARSHQVAVRLSPAENALLQAAAASSGKSAPSVLRDAFLASAAQDDEADLIVDFGPVSQSDRALVAWVTGGGIRNKELQVEFDDEGEPDA